MPGWRAWGRNFAIWQSWYGRYGRRRTDQNEKREWREEKEAAGWLTDRPTDSMVSLNPLWRMKEKVALVVVLLGKNEEVARLLSTPSTMAMWSLEDGRGRNVVSRVAPPRDVDCRPPRKTDDRSTCVLRKT